MNIYEKSFKMLEDIQRDVKNIDLFKMKSEWFSVQLDEHCIEGESDYFEDHDLTLENFLHYVENHSYSVYLPRELSREDSIKLIKDNFETIKEEIENLDYMKYIAVQKKVIEYKKELATLIEETGSSLNLELLDTALIPINDFYESSACW